MLPNSEIRQVVNRSKVIGTVEVDVPVPVEAELQPVLEELERSMQELAEDDSWAERLLSEPVVVGVQKVDLDRIDVRVSARSEPGDRIELTRELRRRAAAATTTAVNDVWGR